MIFDGWMKIQDIKQSIVPESLYIFANFENKDKDITKFSNYFDDLKKEVLIGHLYYLNNKMHWAANTKCSPCRMTHIHCIPNFDGT
jgi:hypothetical protein